MNIQTSFFYFLPWRRTLDLCRFTRNIWVSEGVFRMRPSVCPFMRVHIDFLYTVTEVKTSQSLPVCVQMVGSVTLFWLIRRCGPVSWICWLNCDRVSATKPTHGGQTGTTPRQTARHTRHISWWMGLRGPHPLDPIIRRQMMRGIDLSEWRRQMEWVCPSSSSIKPKTDDIELFVHSLSWHLEECLKNRICCKFTLNTGDVFWFYPKCFERCSNTEVGLIL